jgi:hypothetical protein
MSKCSSSVFLVNGRVGLVDDGKTFGSPANLDDIGRMAAAGAFGVKGVDGPALERADRRLDEAAFIQRVRVERYLDIETIGDRETAIDRGGRRAPILMQFQTAGAGLDHFNKRGGFAGVAFAEESEIDRQAFRRLQHLHHVPRSRRAGGGLGTLRRSRAATEHGRNAAIKRLLDLLRADEMDMGVDPAGG